MGGVIPGDYCAHWGQKVPWCYLAGRANAKECPGAVLSGTADIYWTEDADICRAAEKNRNSSESFLCPLCLCNLIGPCESFEQHTIPGYNLNTLMMLVDFRVYNYHLSAVQKYVT